MKTLIISLFTFAILNTSAFAIDTSAITMNKNNPCHGMEVFTQRQDFGPQTRSDMKGWIDLQKEAGAVATYLEESSYDYFLYTKWAPIAKGGKAVCMLLVYPKD